LTHPDVSRLATFFTPLPRREFLRAAVGREFSVPGENLFETWNSKLKSPARLAKFTFQIPNLKLETWNLKLSQRLLRASQ